MLELARADPHRYVGQMRLKTAFELKDAMTVLSNDGHKVETPFLIIHGTGGQSNLASCFEKPL